MVVRGFFCLAALVLSNDSLLCKLSADIYFEVREWKVLSYEPSVASSHAVDCCFCLQTALPGSLADSLLPPSLKHTCSHCGKRFSRVSNLRRHDAMHSGCYPCWCEICGKGCLSANNRRRHMTIHTSIRPWNQNIYLVHETCLNDNDPR